MAANEHTYYPPRRQIIVFVLKVLAVASIVPLLALVYLLLFGSVTALSLLILLGGTLFYLAVGAGLAFLLHTQFLRPRLTLSPRGVEYRHRTLNLFAPWDRVEAIGDRRTKPNGEIIEGLILRDVANKPEPSHAPDPYAIERNRFIPLESFHPNWRVSQLGDELRYYAPILFPEDR